MSAAKQPSARPLSPHLSVYRWELHMVLSILHRATGIALSAGTLLLTWWLVAAASGPEAYDLFTHLAGGILGRLVLFGFTWALFHHAISGIRHLYFDTGSGFELDAITRTGWYVVAISVILTIASWVAAYVVWGKI